MKTRSLNQFFALALFALVAFDFLLSTAFAQSTVFTYQGRLKDHEVPISGTYDFRFRAASDVQGNNFVGSASVINGVSVTNGLFTAPVDFGAAIFNGASLWLQIEVRTNGASGYNALFPLQPLTPTPYALTAANIVSGGIPSSYTNVVTFNNTANSFSGNGSGLTGLWKVTGNSGVAPGTSFLGTTDNQPLELKVNSVRALRMEPTATDGAVNVIGGSPLNSVTPGVVGATIGGGGAQSYQGYVLTNRVTGDFGFVGGGGGNVSSDFGTIGGGFFNTTTSQGATVGGGLNNTSGGTIGGGFGNMTLGGSSTVAGGSENTSSALVGSTVSGGFYNTASGDYSTVSGGQSNLASGDFSTVLGGLLNTASANYSFAAGTRAKAIHDGTFVWSAFAFTDFASTSPGQFLIRADNGVGIGTNHPFGALHVVSASTAPQVWISQNNSSDYTRLRMKVGTNPFWEMDVSPGATPSLGFWNSTLRMSIDYNGNVTATTFTPSSDRNLKENFQPVNARDVLDKVAALPLTEWNFKQETTKHLGPMAQDFYAAFGVGADNKHIATVDADGVALAAIKGLNEKLEARSQAEEAKIKNLEAENTELKQAVNELKDILRAMNNKANDGAKENTPSSQTEP